MSKYGTTANKAANSQYGTQSGQANANAQQDLSQFNQNEANLEAGKQVGANPYMNPQYLAAVNRLRSGALNENANAGEQQLRANNARTGGMNSTATTGAIGNLALQKARLGNQLGAEQTAGDWAKNIGYQQQLAGMPLQAAGAQGDLYRTATGGQGVALKNLTDLQNAQNAQYMQMAQLAMKAAASGAAGGMGFNPAAGMS